MPLVVDFGRIDLPIATELIQTDKVFPRHLIGAN